MQKLEQTSAATLTTAPTDLESALLSDLFEMMGDVPLELPETGPLVGRADDLDRLARLAHVRLAADSVPRSSVVLLTGDAGIGKTSVVIALGRQAQAKGWRVVVGHCLDFGGDALPYLPFTEIFGRLDADAPSLVDAMTAEHPPINRLLSGRRSPSATSTYDADRVDRTELFEAVHAALAQVAAEAPLLLVLEDLHWADQSTRDLLTFLFTRRFAGSVSVVVSYRGEDLHRRHPLRAAAAQWARLPGVVRLELGPLSDADVRSLVRQLHPDPLMEREIHAVVERAEGNAFFTEELVAATAVGHGALPSDLAGLLLLRLDQLDDAARQVVRVAAAAGRGVTHAVLARVVDMGAAALDDALRGAVEGNVLVTVGADSYAFRHAMLSEAIYDDLLPGERVRIHAAYVRALVDGQVAGRAADLARHARAAHDSVTAARASVRAGDEAMAVGGPDEALQHYELALELATDVRPDDSGAADYVVELSIKASAAATASGNPHKAVALIEEQLARPGSEPMHRARLLHALATAALLSDLNVDALAASTEALHLVPAEPLTALRCRILGVHARALADRGRDDDAVRWGQDALAQARSLGLREVVADVTTTLARLQLRSGDPEASRAALERVIVEAHEVGDAAELRGLHNLAGLFYEQGQLTDALRTYQRGIARALELGRPWAPYGLDSRVLAAVVAYDAGEWDTALELTDVRGQSPSAMAEAALGAAALSVRAGRGDGDIQALLPPIRPWWGTDGVIAVLCAGPAIDLLGAAGDVDGAIALHDELVVFLGDLWQLPDFQARVRLSALLLAQLVVQAGRTSGSARVALASAGEELAAAAARAAAGPQRRVPLGSEAAAWALRARAEHLRLRWATSVDPPAEDELVSAWQDSVAGFHRYPHVFELARSQTRLAAVLRAVGDAASARELADAARETAHRLGAQPLLKELRAGGSAAVPRRDQVGADQPLTPREHEVLQLVAMGRSNREIGARLYISSKTVSVHVSNILAKLDAAGRTEAVAVARRRGVLTG